MTKTGRKVFGRYAYLESLKVGNERPHPQIQGMLKSRVCEVPCCACISMLSTRLDLNEMMDKDGLGFLHDGIEEFLCKGWIWGRVYGNQ